MAIFMQRVWDFIWDAKTSLFIDSPTAKWNKTSKGYLAVLNPQKGGGGTPGQNAQIVIYDSTGATAYAGGTIAIVQTLFTLAGITVLPGTYALLSSESTPASPTGNQIPQIPVPISGTIYWIPIAAGLIQASACNSGGSSTIYVNSTGTF